MAGRVKILESPFKVAEAVASEIVGRVNEAERRGGKFNLVLSGGSTPYFLFSILTDQFSNSLNWGIVHLFWGDERCVHPSHAESNWGMAFHNLIDKIDIPEQNLHRIKGEENPVREAERYSSEILKFTELKNGIPSFDLILLGLGEDGHTASIFPGQTDLFKSEKICEATIHPVTKQRRITLTGRVINNAGSVIFMATGEKKAKIVADIIENKFVREPYPASLVNPEGDNTEWFIDPGAASQLSKKP